MPSYRRLPVTMKILSLIFLLLIFEMSVQAAPRCDEVLQNFDVVQNIRALARLKLQIELSKAEGTQSLNLTALTSDSKKKEKELIQFLQDEQIMSEAQLKARLKSQIAELQKVKELTEKEDAESEEEQRRRFKEEVLHQDIDGYRAVFHRIEPGPFKMGKPGQTVDVEITKAFEMMATPTTQIIWKAIAELANTKLGYSLDPNPSQFKGDTLPVEQVNWIQVEKWIEALNKLSEAGEPELANWIPNHKKGDLYQLPSEAEWEFVVRGRGEYNGEYPFDNSELDDYVWYSANSERKTHPVAQKKSILVAGKPFYDLLGNVEEWVQDAYQRFPPGGIDPRISIGIHGEKVTRGGSQLYAANHAYAYSRRGKKTDCFASSTGFRLVKVITP